MPLLVAVHPGIWLNDGLGNFTDSGQGAGSATDVALGDIDRDGDLDILAGGGSYKPNEVWVNNGGTQGGVLGTFSYNNQFLGVTSSDAPVDLGDVNEDGHLDAIIGFWGGDGDKVWGKRWIRHIQRQSSKFGELLGEGRRLWRCGQRWRPGCSCSGFIWRSLVKQGPKYSPEWINGFQR